MTAPLLRTKLYVPRPPSELVPRPRLLERLDAGLGWHSDGFARKLTLVSAPAGFGKTTLLGECAAHCGRLVPKTRFAWLSLDDRDNDPTTFLAYLIAALQTIETGLGKGAMGALQAPEPPPVEGILTTLINEIAQNPISPVLVLDDYHLIEAPTVHDALGFLLDHLPPQMHLVIASRADPPLFLSRLRGRGQLNELRA
ncbi:MAG TPA: helix-turn-helix transcriptional regulator, partial [Anaerolineae bacterium]|nr:helix-turn-helix transcriptional regulator [Anaerolineae bacterium]